MAIDGDLAVCCPNLLPNPPGVGEEMSESDGPTGMNHIPVTVTNSSELCPLLTHGFLFLIDRRIMCVRLVKYILGKDHNKTTVWSFGLLSRGNSRDTKCSATHALGAGGGGALTC